jgi:hypothetical protein
MRGAVSVLVGPVAPGMVLAEQAIRVEAIPVNSSHKIIELERPKSRRRRNEPSCALETGRSDSSPMSGATLERGKDSTPWRDE